ncbi:uncharacterized protein [Apostichopus japonicus]|uniref:uncharacterized protein n=1 Tax=Stichopus japonicus TaxID=307972 RepID=UPI003AB2156D
MDNTTTVIAFIFSLIAISTALPLSFSMALLRTKLISTHTNHAAVYESIKMKRFSNPDKVLPEQFINGMEPVKRNLNELENALVIDPALVYPMHYESLVIFREAFFQLAVKEQMIADYNEVVDMEMEQPAFHKEVVHVKKLIDESLKHLRRVMHQISIEVPPIEVPQIILPHEVDGRLCEGYCDLERHLYIHQQFNYFMQRAIHSIASIEEEV